MTAELIGWTGHPLGPPIVVHCSAGIPTLSSFRTLILVYCSVGIPILSSFRTTHNGSLLYRNT